MSEVIEGLKLVASGLSAIIVIGTFFTAACKPIRKRFVNWVVKISGNSACNSEIKQVADTVKKIQNDLTEHITQSETERKTTLNAINNINNKLDNSMESQRNTCRNLIVDMYYKYGREGEIPRYKHELLIKTYSNYKSMGGNSFIDEIYKEMKEYKVVD